MIKNFKIITLCGSTKFKEDFLREQERLSLQGNIVISVDFFEHTDGFVVTEDLKKLFDEKHRAKIELSDEVFVINKGGYIGTSTKNEIAYAKSLGKPVKYMEDPTKAKKPAEALDDVQAKLQTLRNQIEDYKPFDEQEQTDKVLFLHSLDKYANVLTRDSILVHFTASAFVLNKQHTKMLVVHHNIFNSFVYPGGHADGDADLLAVAKREVEEETGLKPKVLSNDIFGIAAFAIDGHIKHGKYVSSHDHLDVSYLMEADENLPLKICPDENSEIKWIDISKADTENMPNWFEPVYKKFVLKLKATGVMK